MTFEPTASGTFFEEALRWRERQYATLAEIGLLASRERDIELVLNRAAAELRSALDADFTKVLDHRASATGMLVRAGDGWPDGVVGEREVPEGFLSQGGYTLETGAAVIVEDMLTETRFVPPSLLLEHGVRSGISVLIEGSPEPYGVLQADSRRPSAFRAEDVPVMQAYANVLSGAIGQREREDAAQRFAAIISHELRTPLTSMIGFSRRLLRRLDATGTIGLDRREELLIVMQEAIRLERSLDLFLAVAEVDRGREVSAPREWCDLNELVRRAMTQIQERYPEVQLSIEGDGARVELLTEEMAFGRIIGNLLENAARYSPAGSAVSTELAANDDGVIVRVIDACGGVPAEDLRHVFQREFRGQNARGSSGGLGLGLYVSLRLAERLGGTIAAENVDDRGCVFTLRLPTPTQDS